eukprot:TRINITY_DN547_c0_g1_i3.p2 TRINITY_DN547_c0_g1~~TRINITY_DN547_c0_g1_i3.p2  ORF type:complete len:453 (+),score=97.62 TRINITY_DN547_c0_g1_i3:2441-3799(+)
MKPALAEKPKVHRLQASKNTAKLGAIDPTGGRWGAGIIPGVSLCTHGEALGHYAWIDAVMLQQIADQCNANAKLLKSRFQHPDLCADGTGKALGTIENARVAGDQVLGDMHLYKTAHRTPNGDLAGYVMSFCSEDPENAGLSIVFEHDCEAEELFEAENTQEVEWTDGEAKATEVRFVSPDPLNTDGLPHARVKRLWAADFVDDPAANAGGMFHRQHDVLTQATALLDYATGRTDAPPKSTSSFSTVAPERLKEFLTKYLAKNGLTIQQKDASMATDQTKPEDDQPEDPKAKPDETTSTATQDETAPGDKPAEESPAEAPAGDAPEDPPENSSVDPEDDEEGMPKEACSTEKLQKFVSKFGAEHGAAWAIEGITYTKALERHCDALTIELTDANERLKALGQSGTKPFKFSHGNGAAPGKGGTSTQSSEKLNEVCGEGLGRIAAAIKLPTSK